MSTLKCVAVGDVGIGKTGMLMSYIKNKFPSEYVPTVSANYDMTVMVDEEPYTLKLFDTSGHEDYDRLRAQSYQQTDVFLVCYSVVSPRSFESIKEKWVPEINYHCPGVPFVLVATQIDLRDDPATIQELARDRKEKPVTQLVGEQIAKDLCAFKFVECSGLTQEGLKNVFDDAVEATRQPSKESKKCTLI